MILKGSARSAPGELAHHLLREDTNESVRVLELRGVASLDLPGALAELDGMGAGARSRRPLYHASINTPVPEQLTAEQQRIARERLAAKLGLEGQPYVVVEHVKAGRQHTHIVWSRIDQATGKAIPDSHNYRRHEEVARELEREFGHQHVLGVHVRDKAAEPRPGRTPSWGEQRQAERSGLTPQEAKRQITGLWQQTRTGTEFMAALTAEGWSLARGDRRDFVLFDRTGEMHSLRLRLDGVRAAQVRERMADVDVDRIPTVDQAKARLRQVPAPEPEMGFIGAIERERIEEDQAQERTKPAPLPFASEAASAIHVLTRTMGAAELGRVIVSEDRTRADKTWQQVLRQSDSIEQRLDRESNRRVSGGAELAGQVPEAIPRPSVEAETPAREQKPMPEPPQAVDAESPDPRQDRARDLPADLQRDRQPEPQRPNAVLFVRVLGSLVEHYQRVLDKAMEEMKIAKKIEPASHRPPAFDPRFAREELTPARYAPPQPEARRPPAFDPKYAREEIGAASPVRQEQRQPFPEPPKPQPQRSIDDLRRENPRRSHDRDYGHEM